MFRNSLEDFRSALAPGHGHDPNAGARVGEGFQMPQPYFGIHSYPLSEVKAVMGGTQAASVLDENVTRNAGSLPINHLDLTPN